MTNPITVSATRFRIALTASLFLSLAIAIAVVIYGVRYLETFADEVNAVAIEADNSESRIAIMQQEATNLESNKTAVERAKDIVAESESYGYQDIIIRDIEEFARRAGVGVQSYDFTASQPANTRAPRGAANSSRQAPAATSGPKSTAVNVTLANPVNYQGLLRFVHLIEQNLTRMQIANLTMSGNSDDKDSVTSSNFIIQVYIR